MKLMEILPAAVFITIGLVSVWGQSSCSSPRRESKIAVQEMSKSSITSVEIPTVEFCEVLKRPFLYQSKIIKIKGDMGRFRDYITFYDESCVPTHPLIGVVFDHSFQYNYKDAVGHELSQIIHGSEEANEGKIHIFVSAVGLFEAIPQDERSDFTEIQYRFTIRNIDLN